MGSRRRLDRGDKRQRAEEMDRIASIRGHIMSLDPCETESSILHRSSSMECRQTQTPESLFFQRPRIRERKDGRHAAQHEYVPRTPCKYPARPVSPFFAILDRVSFLITVNCPDLRNNIRDFLQSAFTNWGLNVLTLCDLPNLTLLNTFDALARNSLTLQIPLKYLEIDDHNSLFDKLGPPSPGEQPAFPTHLHPTQLQSAVPHHSWLDLFPIPEMRDNILRGIETGQCDEDLLCSAPCCDLLDLEAGTKASVLVWGEALDAGNWEFSLEFFGR